MRHVNEGILRRMIDDADACSLAAAAHVRSCVRCGARLHAIAEDTRTMSSLLTGRPPDIDVRAAYAATSRRLQQNKPRLTHYERLASSVGHAYQRSRRLAQAAVAVAVIALLSGLSPSSLLGRKCAHHLPATKLLCHCHHPGRSIQSTAATRPEPVWQHDPLWLQSRPAGVELEGGDGVGGLRGCRSSVPAALHARRRHSLGAGRPHGDIHVRCGESASCGTLERAGDSCPATGTRRQQAERDDGAGGGGRLREHGRNGA